mgnify:CR=1 FL=1
MTPDTLENWRKIRDHLERVGQIDNHYYKRALAICNGLSDPFDRYTEIDGIWPNGGRT